MKQPFGLILAGGQARRMGGADKALLPLAGQSLLAHVTGRLAPQVDRLALSANGAPERFAQTRLPVLPDTVPDWPGPLAGVLAGLDWVASLGGDTLVSVPCDTPFLPCDLVPRLLLVSEGMPAPLVQAESGGRVHPVVALWPVSLRDALRQALAQGVRRVGAFAAEHGARQAQFADPGGDPFFNINNPEDLKTAGERLG